MAVLVLAEHDNSDLKPATLNAITAAFELGDVTLLVAGHQCALVAEQAAVVAGVSKVLLADDVTLAHALPEAMAPLLVELAGGYTHILAGATTTAKNILPRASMWR